MRTNIICMLLATLASFVLASDIAYHLPLNGYSVPIVEEVSQFYFSLDERSDVDLQLLLPDDTSYSILVVALPQNETQYYKSGTKSAFAHVNDLVPCKYQITITTYPPSVQSTIRAYQRSRPDKRSTLLPLDGSSVSVKNSNALRLYVEDDIEHLTFKIKPSHKSRIDSFRVCDAPCQKNMPCPCSFIEPVKSRKTSVYKFSITFGLYYVYVDGDGTYDVKAYTSDKEFEEDDDIAFSPILLLGAPLVLVAFGAIFLCKLRRMHARSNNRTTQYHTLTISEPPLEYAETLPSNFSSLPAGRPVVLYIANDSEAPYAQQ